MKKLQIILLITFLGIFIFPQEKYEIKQSVKDFFDLAGSKVIKQNKLTKLASEPSQNEIKDIMQMYYKAKAEDPIGFKILMERQFKKYQDTYFKEGKLGIKPGVKMRIMRETMGKKYGENFVRIIGVPYYLKIKIDSMDQQKFHSYVDPRLEGRQVNLRCTIEEVIKGKNKFSIGDTITISYLGWWLRNTEQEFNINGKYFAAVQIWRIQNPYFPEYTLKVINNKNTGLYPIKNGTIELPEDYFRNKSQMDWNQFKVYFQHKFMDVTGINSNMK